MNWKFPLFRRARNAEPLLPVKAEQPPSLEAGHFLTLEDVDAALGETVSKRDALATWLQSHNDFTTQEHEYVKDGVACYTPGVISSEILFVHALGLLGYQAQKMDRKFQRKVQNGWEYLDFSITLQISQNDMPLMEAELNFAYECNKYKGEMRIPNHSDGSRATLMSFRKKIDELDEIIPGFRDAIEKTDALYIEHTKNCADYHLLEDRITQLHDIQDIFKPLAYDVTLTLGQQAGLYASDLDGGGEQLKTVMVKLRSKLCMPKLSEVLQLSVPQSGDDEFTKTMNIIIGNLRELSDDFLPESEQAENLRQSTAGLARTLIRSGRKLTQISGHIEQVDKDLLPGFAQLMRAQPTTGTPQTQVTIQP